MERFEGTILKCEENSANCVLLDADGCKIPFHSSQLRPIGTTFLKPRTIVKYSAAYTWNREIFAINVEPVIPEVSFQPAKKHTCIILLMIVFFT